MGSICRLSPLKINSNAPIQSTKYSISARVCIWSDEGVCGFIRGSKMILKKTALKPTNEMKQLSCILSENN